MPAWRASSAAASAVKGVYSDGLTTTVQPQANAGPTWHITKQEVLFFSDASQMQELHAFYRLV